MGDNDEILREFLLESTENLDQLDRDLLELEKHPSSKEILSSIFRSIHTIKGATGFFGFPKLESLTHSGESLLGLLRDGKLSLTPEITRALLVMAGGVREMLVAIHSTGRDGEGEYASIIENLRNLQATGKRPSAPKPDPESTMGDQRPASLQPETPAPLGQILIRSGYASEADVEAALRAQRAGDPRYLGEILVERGVVASHVIRAAMEEQAKAQASSLAANTIRVDVEQLHKLTNLAGELVRTRDQIIQFKIPQEEPRLLSLFQRLNSITNELHATVLKTRMEALDALWRRVALMARDLAASCGKRVRVEIEGSETELDRTIIQAIRDPLMHIVRNAVDHGIEPPGKRVEAGKPPEGRISLRASREGEEVTLEISDDGAGVDLDRVKRIAIERGLVTPALANSMDERETCRLLFLPGFSTAAKITNISGRGVGMDVVKTNIERIGGTVELDSKAGGGLTLKMKLPLTLATVPALMIACGGEQFAIPQVNLIELIRLKKDEATRRIEVSDGASVYRLRGRRLPLVNLGRALGLRSSSPNGARSPDIINIAVLQADSCQFGLVVDEAGEKEDIVIKPLGEQLKHLSVYAGGSIVGDGKVALILDVVALARGAGILSKTGGPE
jgi:two-component system chemotaxis sensor kinase CheA